MSLEGGRSLQARLTAVGNTRGLIHALGLETVRGAKHNVARKTGTTGRTIRLARETDTTATVTVGGAGVFLERGTRPHVIRPRKGRFLRFPAKGTPVTLAGRARTGAVRQLGSRAYVFARIVHHPGTKPQPFLIPAAKAAIAKVGIGSMVERWNGAA